jgi:hypothetical protein
MIDWNADLQSYASIAFTAVAGVGWMAVTIGWLVARNRSLQVDEKEARFEVERRMVAAIRLDEIRHEKLARENIRLAVQARVLGGDPPKEKSGEPGNQPVAGDVAQDDRSDAEFFADMFDGKGNRTRHYTVTIEVDSPVARRAEFRCVDKSRDLSSKRIDLVIEELNSGTQLLASNCWEMWHDDRWVFEARLPQLASIDAGGLPRVVRRRKSDWMKHFDPKDLPLTDRQRIFDELANWFLRLVEGREQASSGDLARSVEEWENYMDPLPPYEGQRVYRRTSLEEPKVRDKTDDGDES